MTVESRQFEIIKEECLRIFNDFDKNMKVFLDSLKAKFVKRSDKKALNKKRELEHTTIQYRLDEIADHRRENEKLLEIVSSIFSEESDTKSKEAIKDIKDAYTVFLSINVLNMSMEGEERWQKAKKQYNMKIDAIEGEITTQMRDRLASAKTTNEMFRTFSKFNALFSRPRIRGAIQEYQNQILSSIKKDIKDFRERLTVKYNTSEVCKMYKYRNFPNLSGLLTWYKQLERKVEKFQGRIKDVLGAGWEKVNAGKQLKQQIDPISKHLVDIQRKNKEQWIDEMNKIKVINVKSPQLFKIVNNSDGSLKLEVNFSKKALSLFREKNTLKSLDEKIPHSLIMKTQEVQLCYPFYISLVDNLATFHHLDRIITDDIAMLLVSRRSKVQNQLKLGTKISWKAERNLNNYDTQTSRLIQELEDSTHDVLEKNEKKNKILQSLQECPYGKNEFAHRLKELQTITDDFGFSEYSNIFKWVELAN